jgi:multiple sugar transport system ATP-binding protein
MANVILKDVVKQFKTATAVDRLSIEIPDREFAVLVGPSGCGKTTALRMIAGLEPVTSGEIYIGDRLVNDVPPKDRDIAMVFQNYALYPHMTVHENMAFALKMRKISRAEIDERVRSTAELLGIGDLLSRKPKALSGGQRQRVAVGRAIVREPKVFLMDEPLSNLDAKLRVQMRAELSKLHNRLQTTMIYVTHDQTEAMTMGDRIVVMKDGQVQQVGPPLEIYSRPDNMFVAGFIGSPSMNFIKGVLDEKSGGVAFSAFGFEWILNDKQAKKVRDLGYIGKEVIFGTRPEDIKYASQQSAGNFQACIEVIEYTGSEVYLHCSGFGEKMLTIRAAGVSAKRGDTINLALNIDRAHIFDTFPPPSPV